MDPELILHGIYNYTAINPELILHGIYNYTAMDPELGLKNVVASRQTTAGYAQIFKMFTSSSHYTICWPLGVTIWSIDTEWSSNTANTTGDYLFALKTVLDCRNIRRVGPALLLFLLCALLCRILPCRDGDHSLKIDFPECQLLYSMTSL